MRKIIVLVLVFVGVFCFEGVQVYAQELPEPNSLSTASYFCNNIDEFNQQLEIAYKNEEININNCDEIVNVNLVDLTGTATLVDFNGNHGYALFLDDYIIEDFEFEGNLKKVTNFELYFSTVDGIYYIDSGNEKVSLLASDEQVDFRTGYDGQYGDDGVGRIYNLNDYITDRYGSGFYLNDENTLVGYTHIIQSTYSTIKYRESKSPDIGYSYSNEGNCSLTSIYAVMKYWAEEKGYTDIPTANISYDATTESFYVDHHDDQLSYISSKTYVYNPYYGGFYVNNYSTIDKYYILGSTTKYVPESFLEMKEIAYGYGYSPDGGTNPTEIDNIAEDSFEHYGYTNMDIYNDWVWSFNNNVVKHIDNNNPVIWSSNDFTVENNYGSHTVTVIGYKEYLKTTKILFITIKDYLHFMEINDNWSPSSKYFDYDKYASGFGTGVFTHIEED